MLFHCQIDDGFVLAGFFLAVDPGGFWCLLCLDCLLFGTASLSFAWPAPWLARLLEVVRETIDVMRITEVCFGGNRHYNCGAQERFKLAFTPRG